MTHPYEGKDVWLKGHNVADGGEGTLWKFYEIQLIIETEEQFNALTTQLKKDPDFNLTWLLNKYNIEYDTYEAHWGKDEWDPDGDYLYGSWDLGKL